MDLDQRVRAAAFAYLRELCRKFGQVLPRTALIEGFILDEQYVPLIAQWGIWKPKIAEVPLSITTAPRYEQDSRPAQDVFDADGLMRYAYRGTLPYQNNGLREAMRRGAALVYFHGVEKGHYRAFWPVYIVDDDSASMTFVVSRNQPAIENQTTSSGSSTIEPSES